MEDKIARAKAQLRDQKQRREHNQATLSTDNVTLDHAYQMFWRQGKMTNGFTSRHNYWYMLIGQWAIKLILFGFAFLFSIASNAPTSPSSQYFWGWLYTLTNKVGMTGAIFSALMLCILILIAGYTLSIFIPMLTMTMRRYKDTGLNRFWGALIYLVLSLLVIAYFFVGPSGKIILSCSAIVLEIVNLLLCSSQKEKFNK